MYTAYDYYKAIEELFKGTNKTKGLNGFAKEAITSSEKSIVELKKQLNTNEKGFLGIPSKHNREIEKRIKREEDYIKKNKEELAANARICGYLFSIMHNDLQPIDTKSKEAMNIILPYLNEEERKKLKEIANNSYKKANKKVEERIEKYKAAALAEIIASHAERYTVNVNKSGITAKKMLISMAVKAVADRTLAEKAKLGLIYVYPEIEMKKGHIETQLEEIRKSKGYEKTPTYEKVKKHYDKLIKTAREIERLEKEIYVIENYRDINGETYGEVRDYLKKLRELRKNELIKKRNFIKQFDLDKIEALASRIEEEVKKEEKKEREEKDAKIRYAAKLREVEELKRNGGSRSDIFRLEQDLITMETYSEANLFDTKQAIMDEYRAKDRKEEFERREKEDKAEKERRYREAKDALDYEAEIRYQDRCRSNWKFNASDEEKSRELKEIKAEIVHEARMTPEERALSDLQKFGIISPKTTLANLTEEEKDKVARQAAYTYDKSYDHAIKSFLEMSDGSIDDDPGMFI